MADGDSETLDQRTPEEPSAGRPVPGLVLVWSVGRPRVTTVALDHGALTLGRGTDGPGRIGDRVMSRDHAQVRRGRDGWSVRDLGSRNGTFVDGQRVTDATARDGQVLRVGETLFLLVADVRPYADARPSDGGGPVMGPTLTRVWQTIARAAREAETLHLSGETGAGKELAARAFHDLGPRAAGPFVPVNCATIPESVAERLLFGARKGAFSGAHTDTLGHVQAANGGTLFLDEVGELDLAVQAKLLRVLETREVVAMGATTAQRLELRLVSATHRDLRALVAAGRFREDLYFRIGRPRVVLPPLRERREDIPLLIEREARAIDAALVPNVTLIEQCLLRSWPGNVRELRTELRDAAQRAHADGVELTASLLPADAGGTLIAAPVPVAPVPAVPVAPAGDTASADDDAGAAIGTRPLPAREVIEELLRREHGKVATVARLLQVHRNTLRRWLAKHNLDPASFGSEATTDDD